MKPAAFEYVRPETIDEAIQALDHDDAKIIAGGQSLLPMMNFRVAQPERIVDINRIDELSLINRTDNCLGIGALVRHVEAAQSDLLATYFPIIAEAMGYIAHVAIRNRGTIAGSLSHADPSAEWSLLVTLLEGKIKIAGCKGTRLLDSSDFFVAPLVTDLEESEIVTGILLPFLPTPNGMAFEEIAQRAGDFAILTAAAFVHTKYDKFSEVRLALGGISDVPVRATELEKLLTDKPATSESIEDVLQFAIENLEPIDDLHASAAYRLSLVPTLSRRVLNKAVERALRW